MTTNKATSPSSSQSQNARSVQPDLLDLINFIMMTNVTIMSGNSFYYAYNNHDTRMILFIGLVSLYSLLCHNLPPNSPKRRNFEMSRCAFLAIVMLWLACEFSDVTSLAKSLLCFIAVVLYNYLLWISTEGVTRVVEALAQSMMHGNADKKEDKPLCYQNPKGVDNA